MSHIIRRRGHGYATVIVVGLSLLMLAIGAASIPCILRVTGAESAAIAEQHKQETAQSLQTTPVKLAIMTSDWCKPERKFSPAAGEGLYPYIVGYLTCIDPQIMQDDQRFQARYQYMLDAFRTAFPDANPRRVPPAVTIQILGPPGSESIDPRYSGLEPTP